MFSTRTGLVWDTNMAAVSLFWDIKMAAVTTCGNALFWGWGEKGSFVVSKCTMGLFWGTNQFWCILKYVFGFEAPRHKKWSHLEAQRWITHFFALFPQSLKPSMNLNTSKLVCFNPAFSLRTADVFPVVASLHIFRRERSDDRKYVCCAQASPKQFHFAAWYDLQLNNKREIHFEFCWL